MRTWLTAHEARVAALERQYLAGCHTAEFAIKYPAYRQPLSRANVYVTTAAERQLQPGTLAHNIVRVDYRLCYAWIVHKLHGGRMSFDRRALNAEIDAVRRTLRTVSDVFFAHDMAGLAGLPEVCP